MGGLECEKCKYRFAQKSSLVRHRKSCMQDLTTSLRQKSCSECVVAKTKCDLRRPACSRCAVRQTRCEYADSSRVSRSDNGSEPNNSHQSVNDDSVRPTARLPTIGQHLPGNTVADNSSFPISGDVSRNPLSGLSPVVLDGDLNSTLGALDDPKSMGAGCLSSTSVGESENHATELALSILPSAGTIPVLARHSMETMLRVFRSWPRMMAKKTQLPPIIHSTQVLESVGPTPLANCFTLVKMWDGQSPGTSRIVQDTLKKELQSLLDSYLSFDETNLLEALQALVMYTLLLLFPSKAQVTVELLEENMFRQMRDIVYHAAASGLVLQEETDHVRPSWKAWIHVASKRRAVLALYLIHWSYSVYHSLPSYNCAELGFMPAPAAKYLWQAGEKKQWESLYSRWLVQWDSSGFYQWEFHNISTGIWMNHRAEMWLEDADEFGMLFVSIVNACEREVWFDGVHV